MHNLAETTLLTKISKKEIERNHPINQYGDIKECISAFEVCRQARPPFVALVGSQKLSDTLPNILEIVITLIEMILV